VPRNWGKSVVPLGPWDNSAAAFGISQSDFSLVQPRTDGSEKRIFECSKCKIIETKLVDDPIKSQPLFRLMEGIRPPG
jgi:hypothetical protein